MADLPMRLKLVESLDACNLLHEKLLQLDLRLKIITRLTELCKVEAKRKVKALTKCIEEKTAMTANLGRLFSLNDQLQKDCSSSYCSDLDRFVESFGENKRKNEELLAITQEEGDRSEKAKLTKALEALEKNVRNLRNNLTKALKENDAMCEEFTALGEILHKHLVTTEGIGGESSTSSHPTEKPKLEEEAGRSIGNPIDIEDSSDGTPPHSPQIT